MLPLVNHDALDRVIVDVSRHLLDESYKLQFRD